VQQVDIVIVGGGMVGLAAASLLSRAGFTIALVESVKPADFDNDSETGLRVSAFSPGSIRILSEAGAWRQIEQNRHCAYADMHVEELVSSDADDLSVLDFSAGEFALDCLGAIVENDLVQWALWQSLEALGTVGLFCPDKLESFETDESTVSVRLQSGTTLECKLLVGADGSGSRVRKSLGIAQTEWVYAQKGLVSVVECQQKNPGTAWQRFVNGHPLAFLPLEDGRSSIVWTLAEVEADRMLAVDDDSFRSQLGEACGHWLGGVTGSGPRAAFPLGMRLSHSYSGHRTVLLGDAAHVVHPLAGQGVNIGLQDAAALVEALVEARRNGHETGDPKVLERYGRWRRSESEIMARGIDGIKSLFSIPVLGPLRRVGLGLVSRSWLVREAFIRRAAGLNRNAPALSRGTPLQQLVHPPTTETRPR
jgi:2-octaprenyl-3-methyl-6-methoxy-1,4-benzoquinol hydroxylase/2-octaprenylphenol hydroxylase